MGFTFPDPDHKGIYTWITDPKTDAYTLNKLCEGTGKWIPGRINSERKFQPGEFWLEATASDIPEEGAAVKRRFRRTRKDRKFFYLKKDVPSIFQDKKTISNKMLDAVVKQGLAFLTLPNGNKFKRTGMFQHIRYKGFTFIPGTFNEKGTFKPTRRRLTNQTLIDR